MAGGDSRCRRRGAIAVCSQSSCWGSARGTGMQSGNRGELLRDGQGVGALAAARSGLERWLAKLLRETFVITQAGGPAKHNRGPRAKQPAVIQGGRAAGWHSTALFWVCRNHSCAWPIAGTAPRSDPGAPVASPAASQAMARAALLGALCALLFAAAVSAKGPTVTNKVTDPAISC